MPPARRLSPLVAAGIALTLGLGPVAPARAENAGAYLAARVAESRSDFRDAAAWYARAILADPGNPDILQGALYAQLALGNLDLAAEAARQIDSLAEAPGRSGPLPAFALIAAEATAEDYAALIAAYDAGRRTGALTDDLVQAWARIGAGRMSDGLAAFDTLAGREGAEAFGLYHKALALALAGDFEGADDILSGRAAGPIGIMRRGVFAHAQILSQLERNPEAIDLLDRSFGTAPDPAVDALRARLAAGEPVPFDTVRSARDGIAEVFFTVGTALRGEAEDGFTLIHSRIATLLAPDHSDAVLLTADLLQAMDQNALAVETYAQFPPEHPAFHLAEIGRANALYADDQKEAAVEVLRALTRSHGNLVLVHTALGDALRREEAFVEAIAAYDAAIALLPKAEATHWALFFSRGICHEREGQWPQAEADFRRALELNPGQPQVLNYLGYSFVDRGENLEEALKLIEEAVAAQPDAGYIIDSLAWAYFRLGRYEDAVEPMERAALLEPVDPIVTDHLGDVYWAVGRKLEARFQWRRALSFEPEEKDATRIRRKLEVGLDEVLREEGAPALDEVGTAANGN